MNQSDVSNEYPNINPKPVKKLVQSEFDDIMEQHMLYLATKDRLPQNVLGKRACFRGYSLSDVDGRGRNYSYADFGEDSDISFIDLSSKDGAITKGVGANLCGTTAIGTNFGYGDWSTSNQKGINAAKSFWPGCKLFGVDAQNGDYRYADYSGVFGPYYHGQYAKYDFGNHENAKFSHGIFDHATMTYLRGNLAEYSMGSMAYVDAKYSMLYQLNVFGSRLWKFDISHSYAAEMNASFADTGKWITNDAYLNRGNFVGCKGGNAPLSIGPFGKEGDVYNYNPQDNSFSLPPSYMKKGDNVPHPIPSKEIQELAKNDAVLKAILPVVNVYQKSLSYNRGNNR